MGKWIHGREYGRHVVGSEVISINYEDWKCSECGEIVGVPKNFCPECGSPNDTVHWIFRGRMENGVTTITYQCSKCKFIASNKTETCPKCKSTKMY